MGRSRRSIASRNTTRQVPCCSSFPMGFQPMTRPVPRRQVGPGHHFSAISTNGKWIGLSRQVSPAQSTDWTISETCCSHLMRCNSGSEQRGTASQKAYGRIQACFGTHWTKVLARRCSCGPSSSGSFESSVVPPPPLPDRVDRRRLSTPPEMTLHENFSAVVHGSLVSVVDFAWVPFTRHGPRRVDR